MKHTGRKRGGAGRRVAEKEDQEEEEKDGECVDDDLRHGVRQPGISLCSCAFVETKSW